MRHFPVVLLLCAPACVSLLGDAEPLPDASFAPGVYRVTTSVELPVGGSRLVVRSNVFEIVP